MPSSSRISLADVARASGTALGKFDAESVAHAMGGFVNAKIGGDAQPTGHTTAIGAQPKALAKPKSATATTTGRRFSPADAGNHRP